jgi:hypothetical protein
MEHTLCQFGKSLANIVLCSFDIWCFQNFKDIF